LPPVDYLRRFPPIDDLGHDSTPLSTGDKVWNSK